jgi:hypothetical protein
MGMDPGWSSRFLDAYFGAFADELPIWRVFKIGRDGRRAALTDENAWDATWKRVYELRREDPGGRYDCDHSIAYGR